MDIQILLILVAGYLLGSIPFGFLLTRCAGMGDIRSLGSGNIGATNVLRTGDKKLALATLLLDGIKGSCAVWIAMLTVPAAAPYAGLLALLGHMFPIWLKFKGGKGVATILGIVLALAWPVGIMAMLVWLATALLTRISSASALAAVVTMPIFLGIWEYDALILPLTFMALLVILKHWGNIVRLLAGTEPTIGASTKSQPSCCSCCCGKDSAKATGNHDAKDA